MPGTLFVVATPIGNLEDLTPRAGRILREVALVLAEDTRVTRNLCRHLGVGRPLWSYHDHNEQELAATVVERLLAGEDVALVSDAGTPLVNDPGYRLVRAAIDAGVRVVPVPGVSAVMAALPASGLPTDRFTFLGFFPRREAEARELLAAPHDGTLVFFEAPHRLRATLELLAVALPERPLVVARELTKVHEEIVRGRPSEVLAAFADREIRGEMVLLLAPGPPAAPAAEAVDAAAVYDAAVARGASRSEALREASRRSGLPRREVYRRVKGGSGPPSS